MNRPSIFTGPSRIHRRLFARLALTVALLIPLHAARAEPEAAAVLTAVAKINRKALDDYDNLNFDDARRGLESALALCERNGLQDHPLRAQTYLNLGVVMLASDAEHPDVAAAYFRHALEIQANIRPADRIANPEVQRAFADARVQVEAEAKTASRRPPSSRRHTAARAPARDQVEGGGQVFATPDDDDERETGARGGGARWLLALGLGSGLGWTSGAGEVNTDVKVPSGFQPSSIVHLAPEIGYFLRPELLLSLQGRFQFISGTTPERDPSQTMCGADHVCSASTGASAVFMKVTRFLGQGRLRPYVDAALGYGQIRHVVSLPGHNDCGADPAHPVACVDTVDAGPFFLGPGAGALFALAPYFALTLGVGTLVGFSAFTFQVDVNGGIAVEL